MISFILDCSFKYCQAILVCFWIFPEKYTVIFSFYFLSPKLYIKKNLAYHNFTLRQLNSYGILSKLSRRTKKKKTFTYVPFLRKFNTQTGFVDPLVTNRTICIILIHKKIHFSTKYCDIYTHDNKLYKIMNDIYSFIYLLSYIPHLLIKNQYKYILNTTCKPTNLSIVFFSDLTYIYFLFSGLNEICEQSDQPTNSR